MKIEKLNPVPTNKVSFALSSFKQVPKVQGCYVLSTFDNTILYVGLATNLNGRFMQHLDSPEKTNPTSDGKAIWFHYATFDLDSPEKTNPTSDGKAIWFHYATFDPTNLPKLERTWLNQFQITHGRMPILNKVSSPIS